MLARRPSLVTSHRCEAQLRKEFGHVIVRGLDGRTVKRASQR